MLKLEEIEKFYPAHLHPFRQFLLREYLQYKILLLLFESEFGSQFAFLGGTCLRIVYDNNRFSEDLDFDNFNLKGSDFEQVALAIQKGLEREGLQVEMRNVFSGAYHCYIKFPGLLYQTGLSGHKEAKILIQLDTEAQSFDFKPDTYLLNKLDVFGAIRTTPLDILLSQKIYAICNRKQPKGRDFYDVSYLLGHTIPDYEYLSKMRGWGKESVKENVGEIAGVKTLILEDLI